MRATPVTEADLRAAMRDPRYWQPGHPERQAFNDWVGEGWRALVAAGDNPDGTTVVQVRAYRRVRNGRTEFVDAHEQTRRSASDTQELSATEALNQRSLDTARQGAEERRTLMFFVGGAGDATHGNVQRVFREPPERFGLRRTVYRSHEDRASILKMIRNEPLETRVVLVGHSWGGDTVAQVAAQLGREGRRVDTLVTVDPVGRFASDEFLNDVRAGAVEWTNIRATGGGGLAPDNLVALVGGPYGRRVDRLADTNIEAPHSHRQFRRLLTHVDATRTSGWDRALGR